MFPSPLGVSYFQMAAKTEEDKLFSTFPSPLGVSYFQIMICCYFGVNEEWFPSPLGVSYFQILPARSRYFTGFSDSFAWQIIFLYIFLISNIHNRLQMQYLCGARQNYLFSNKLLHIPILTHISHVCIKI